MPTWNNPSPLANPFNSRRYSNFTPGRTCAFTPASAVNRDRLEVPNQDIPPGDQLRGNGFMPGQENLFRLSDGTVVDFKNRKIVKTGKSVPGYWGSPDRHITMEYKTAAGRDEPTLDELIQNVDGYVNTALPDGSLLEPIDANSAAYWLKAEEEAEKLRSNMTDAQKAALDDFEKHFPKSKLIEESMKRK